MRRRPLGCGLRSNSMGGVSDAEMRASSFSLCGALLGQNKTMRNLVRTVESKRFSVNRTRALVAVLPVALVATLLSACSSGEQGGEDCLPNGSVTKSLEFTGDFGSELQLATTPPVQVEELQRSVLVEGEGREIVKGDNVNAFLTIVNGTDGKTISSQPAPFAYDGTQLQPWAFQALSCSSVGDRVVLAAPAEEIVGEGNAESQGLKKSDTVVLVFDLTGVQAGTLDPSELLKMAEGKQQTVPDGLPTVELDADGAPTITMPEGVAPPAELTVVTLIEGDGENVKAGDRVYVHYRGVIWRTGEEFDSSWSRGEPAAFLTTEVIRGFQEALVGQAVGSQVMAIVPADDGGYGADWLTGQGYEPDDVMVFVLDILGTVHPE